MSKTNFLNQLLSQITNDKNIIFSNSTILKYGTPHRVSLRHFIAPKKPTLNTDKRNKMIFSTKEKLESQIKTISLFHPIKSLDSYLLAGSLEATPNLTLYFYPHIKIAKKLCSEEYPSSIPKEILNQYFSFYQNFN